VTPNKRRIVEEYEKRQQLRDSPYLLKSVSVQQSPTKAMLQMEFCEQGDLRNVMLEEPDIWQLVHDIGAALAILHGDGWIHLDVSPGNILIATSCFKLSDFGTLTKIGEFEIGLEGAGPFVSPEVLDFPDGPEITGQTDIFSLGLVLIEVATGVKVPRGGTRDYSAARQGKLKLGMGDYTSDVGVELRDLINAMIDPNPDARPRAGQLVEIAGTVMCK
jgi:serine/threonine protein kinase